MDNEEKINTLFAELEHIAFEKNGGLLMKLRENDFFDEQLFDDFIKTLQAIKSIKHNFIYKEHISIPVKHIAFIIDIVNVFTGFTHTNPENLAMSYAHDKLMAILLNIFL